MRLPNPDGPVPVDFFPPMLHAPSASVRHDATARFTRDAAANPCMAHSQFAGALRHARPGRIVLRLWTRRLWAKSGPRPRRRESSPRAARGQVANPAASSRSQRAGLRLGAHAPAYDDERYFRDPVMQRIGRLHRVSWRPRPGRRSTTGRGWAAPSPSSRPHSSRVAIRVAIQPDIVGHRRAEIRADRAPVRGKCVRMSGSADASARLESVWG